VLRRQQALPNALRQTQGYPVARPGALVEVDTLDVTPLPGMVLKHFTAPDVISRWDLLGVHTRATATTAAGLLEALLPPSPFCAVELTPLNHAFQQGEWTYNHLRPYQAVGSRTPAEYLQQCHPELASDQLSHI